MYPSARTDAVNRKWLWAKRFATGSEWCCRLLNAFVTRTFRQISSAVCSFHAVGKARRFEAAAAAESTPASVRRVLVGEKSIRFGRGQLGADQSPTGSRRRADDGGVRRTNFRRPALPDAVHDPLGRIERRSSLALARERRFYQCWKRSLPEKG